MFMLLRSQTISERDNRLLHSSHMPNHIVLRPELQGDIFEKEAAAFGEFATDQLLESMGIRDDVEEDTSSRASSSDRLPKKRRKIKIPFDVTVTVKEVPRKGFEAPRCRERVLRVLEPSAMKYVLTDTDKNRMVDNFIAEVRSRVSGVIQIGHLMRLECAADHHPHIVEDYCRDKTSMEKMLEAVAGTLPELQHHRRHHRESRSKR